MPQILLALLFITQWNFTFTPVPQTSAQVNDTNVSYQFGESVRFDAQIQSDQPIQEVYVFMQAAGESTRLGKMTANDGNRFAYREDLSQHPMRPFSRVYYWFRITDSSGKETTSPSFWFDYQDNRFTWQTLENAAFRVHWTDGDTAFGQTLMSAAQDGLTSIQQNLPLTLNQTPLDIFVYQTSTDLQSALQLAGQSWVAGYASPDLGVIMVSIPDGPEARMEAERQIPHEMTHVMLYQATGSGYASLPAWLVEGTASMAELSPNPDYPRTLEAARKSSSLLPMSSLCQSFPRDASNAFLAYAQSESFMRYLHKNYGTTGMQALIDQYLNGMGCVQAPAALWNLSLDELDSRWQKESLGINVNTLRWINLAPYFLLAVILLIIPLALSLRARRTRQPAAPLPDGAAK